MFTRVVEFRSKPGKTDEVCGLVSEKMLPVLRKQQGFQDEIVLVSDNETTQVVTLSFWNRQEDAERYHREEFARVIDTVRELCDGDPQVSAYEVVTSTVHRIVQRRAA